MVDYTQYKCPFEHVEKDCGHELHSPEGYEDVYGVWCACGFRGPVFATDPEELKLEKKTAPQQHADGRMNDIAHLLMCLAEEAGEVTQAACKAGRFGVLDVPPDGGLGNNDYIVREINDLLGVVELLQEKGVQLKGIGNRQAIRAKKDKLLAFMTYARDCGTLT